MSVLSAQAAPAAPIGVRAELAMPLPSWDISLPFERELADKLAWRNDHESNDDSNWPGFGWDLPDPDDAGPPVEPSDDDQARYLAGEAIPEADYRERELAFARWDEEARQQAELDWLFFELHSPHAPTYLGDHGVARLALASPVGHPA